jgi:2'-5' RNA ligase
VRLFLALHPDRPAEARVAQRLLQVQEALGATAASLRWTPAANVHATLHFLGEVEPSRVSPLIDRLGTSVDALVFEVALGAVGAFPASGAPRVVWLDIEEGADAVRGLHREIGARVAAAGLPLEARPLSPHLTIARVPDRARAQVKGVRDRLAAVGTFEIRWLVDRVTLFRSDLSGQVPKYEPIHEIALLPTPTSGAVLE